MTKLVHTATASYHRAPGEKHVGFTVDAYVLTVEDGFAVHTIHRFDSGNFLTSDKRFVLTRDEAVALADTLVS